MPKRQRPRNEYEDGWYMSGIGSGGHMVNGPEAKQVVNVIYLPDPSSRSGWIAWNVERDVEPSQKRRFGFA